LAIWLVSRGASSLRLMPAYEVDDLLTDGMKV
jgi:hypothetical protein